MRNIVLSVKRGDFRSDDPNSVNADQEFAKVRGEVLKRDSHSCVFCGFYSDKWQDVHHLDNNHSNNEMDNLVTACPLCHMCHHINYAGIKEMASLIYLDPELGLTQSHVNSITRQIWFAEDSKNSEANSIAVELYYRLFFRSTDIKDKLGDSNPTSLGDVLLNLDDQQYDQREKFLRGVYFLPNKAGFKKQYAYWIKNYKTPPPKDWKRISIQKSLSWYNIQNDTDGMSKKEVVKAFLE